MDRFVIVVFDDERKALEGSRALRELHREGSITLYADAVIAKDVSGKVCVQRAPASGLESSIFGQITGSLAGLLGGPAGLPLGAGTGALVGAACSLTRSGLDADFLDEVSRYLISGKAAIVSELDEEWQAPVDARMEELGGHVFRRNRIAVEDAFHGRELAAFRAELSALEAERDKAGEERKARLEQKLESERRRLEIKEDELEARIDMIRREGEAKLECLRQQLATAREDRKKRLERRLAGVRTDYRDRSMKLHHAWELTRSTLAH